MYRKSMRKALQEARAYRDPLQEDKGFSSQQIKMAYGILNDPRYKQGNYSGAVKAIEKIAKGLSNHPDVANALKRANEETITEFKKMVVTIKDPVKRNQAMQDIQRFGKGTGFRIDKMSDGKSFPLLQLKRHMVFLMTLDISKATIQALLRRLINLQKDYQTIQMLKMQ